MIAPPIEPPALHYHIEQHKILQNSMEKAYRDFLNNYPGYGMTHIDELRSTEYKRLDQAQQVYLDYTGGSLYGQSQLNNHLNDLSQKVFGNPHSENPTSKVTTELIEHARDEILKYFNASAEQYTVIFTSNATGALKLVGESYPFTAESNFLLTFDCHNSVTGIREFVRNKHGKTAYVPLTLPDLRIDRSLIETMLSRVNNNVHNLFVFPAQSNFSGVQHPLDLIPFAQKNGWDVLLDAAAFVPTNMLDLSKYQPEFVVLSFYKMFGYPTGVGCLLCKHTTLAKLKRPWFAGGTVELVSIQGDGYYFHEGCSAFEDGTLNYLTIPAITIGLEHLQKINVNTIHDRVMALTDWLIKELQTLHHSNGNPLIQIYGPTDIHMRGGIIAMNLYAPDGTCIDRDLILERAKQKNISLRAGCFCNPGSIEMINGFSKDDLQKYFTGEHTYTFEEYVQAIGSALIGAVRVSFGIASNFADAYAFVQFAQTFIDIQISQTQVKLHTKHHCSC